MGLLDLYQNEQNGFFNNENDTSKSLTSKYSNTNNYNSLYSQHKKETNNNIWENNSLVNLYSKEAFFNENSLPGMLNVRGRNYQELSIIDKMRGIQANRLNIDTNDLSLAEIYADDKLDNRTMNGMYNVTITDTYKDKKLFNAFHGLYTDGLLTEIEDTQDTGIVQKTYTELEEENVFFQKNNVIKDAEENLNFTTSHNILNNDKIISNEENDTDLIFTGSPINKKNIFKQENSTTLNFLFSNKNNPAKIFHSQNTDLISLYKNRTNKFKPNRTISNNSQTKTENINFTKKSFYKNYKNEEEENETITKENSISALIDEKNSIKQITQNKNHKNFILQNKSIIHFINNNQEENNEMFNRTMSFGSTSDRASFKDTKTFEKKLEQEKEKKLKKLEEIFKNTRIKIEILNKNQLISLIEKLKAEQLKAKKENKVLKYLKIESKIKAIEDYLISSNGNIYKNLF